MRRFALRPIVLTLGASALGALLQSAASGGFAQIAPGRMATLPVAILLGPWYGIVATTLAALPTLVRPTQIVVRVLEALTVGVAARRGHSGLIAGTVFSLANSVAFGLHPEWYGVHLLQPNVWPLAMQQLLNGTGPAPSSPSLPMPWRATDSGAWTPTWTDMSRNRLTRLNFSP